MAIRTTHLAVAFAVALELASGPVLATSFRLIDLGTLPGGTDSFGRAMNTSGQVTGVADTADGETHAFLWDGTTLRDLGTLGGPDSSAVDINASGQVTGSSNTADGETHAFLWDSTTMRDLGTLGGNSSSGADVNDSGQVTGRAETDVPINLFQLATHAFLWDHTSMQDLGAPPFSETEGNSINASGQVAGIRTDINGDGFQAFLWDGTTLQVLHTPDSVGDDINDAGLVTGHFLTDGDFHAFLWDGTTMLDLGTLGGGFAMPSAINASGQVTGSSTTADGEVHAFLWDGMTMRDLGTVGVGSNGNDINASGQVIGLAASSTGVFPFLWDGTTLQDLNALIQPDDPLQAFVHLFADVDINDLGQILANGTDMRTGQNHAYILTPFAVAEPGSLVLLALGLLGLGLTRRKAH